MSRGIRGRKYRSRLEANVAQKAQSSRISFEYEPIDIPWVQPLKNRKYKPDLLLDNNIIIEIKGILSLEDRFKMLQVQEQWPELDIRFVFKTDGWLTKAKKHKYSEWCEKNNYKYAFERIPTTWAKETNKVLPNELLAQLTQKGLR